MDEQLCDLARTDGDHLGRGLVGDKDPPRDFTSRVGTERDPAGERCHDPDEQQREGGRAKRLCEDDLAFEAQASRLDHFTPKQWVVRGYPAPVTQLDSAK